MVSGAEAIRALWRQLPGFRWLARLLDQPIVFWFAHAFYELLAAPILYHATNRKLRKLRQRHDIHTAR